MTSILVAVSEQENVDYLFEKVDQLVAGSDQVDIHVVQVIYEGVADISTSAIEDSTRLKTFILQSAESALDDLVEPLRAKHPGLDTATLWNPRHWEGIVHAAERFGADYIIKLAPHHHRFGEVVRTPDDWNLLRHAQQPVMLVKPEAWGSERLVLCALDPFDDAHQDLNVRLLRTSNLLASQLEGELDVVCAYPLFEPWVGELGAVKSYAEIKDAIEEEIRTSVSALLERSDVSIRMLHLEEGKAPQAIARLAKEAAPSVVALGTHARAGVRGVLLGNTSERILDNLDADIVTVPMTDA